MDSMCRLALLIAVSVSVLAGFSVGNVGSQELKYFNKSSGTEFDKDNVYAEVIPVKSSETTSTASIVNTSTDRDVQEMEVTKTPIVSANKREIKAVTSSGLEPKVAKVIDQGHAEVTTKDFSVAETKSTAETEQGKASTKSAGFWDIDSDDRGENSPPYILYPKTNKRLIYKEGEDTAILCEATGNPTPIYTWFRNGLPIDKSSEPYIKPYKNGTLAFKAFSTRQNGDYHCTAENAFGKALSVKKPIFSELKPTSDPSQGKNASLSRTVDKWQNVELLCGNVPPTIPRFLRKWYDDSSNEVRTDERVGIDWNGDLLFAYTELTDTKSNYRCGLAPPASGWAQTIEFYNPRYLTVRDSSKQGVTAPAKQQVTTNAKAIIGESFVFECFFSGRPVPTIRWKNSSNHHIQGDDPRYKIFDYGRKLSVISVRQEDEGEFKCNATNSYASLEVPLKLNVTTPPLRTPGGSLGTYIKPDGIDFTLVCRARVAEGELVDTPVWYRNAQILREVNFPDPDRYQFNADRTELTIKSMSKAVDTASYQCEIKNSEGSLFMNGYLRVINSIEVTRQPSDVIQLTGNDSASYDITVVARGDSCCRINYLYYFNNTQLTEDTLRLPPFRKNLTEGTISFIPSSVSKATLETWVGTYRCRVSNAHQDVDVHFQIAYNENPVPVEAKKGGMGLWWVGLLCGIIAILITIIIVIIVYKSRYPGETYQLEKTELKHHLEPEKDLLNQSFQEI